MSLHSCDSCPHRAGTSSQMSSSAAALFTVYNTEKTTPLEEVR